MLVASIPTRIDIVWGEGASGTYIRTVPDTTADPNAASFTLGFPPNTFTAPGSGGEPPDGRDFNGAFNACFGWLNWLNAGGAIFYNSAFSTTIGGYPKWATLANASTVGLFWISQVDNNTSDPDTGGANWLQFPATAPANVSSFNTRTGAVTLTSSDVTSALNANSIVNGKLATMPALTVKANVTGSGATPADVAISTFAQSLFQTASLGASGYVILPVVVSGAITYFYFQWGTFVCPNSVTINLPTAFPTAAAGAMCVQNTVQNNVLVVSGLTTSTITIHEASGSGTFYGYWAAWGY